MLIETLSTKLIKALSQGNSGNSSFTPPKLWDLEPNAANLGVDGFWGIGQDGGYTANRIFVMPYGDAVGANFLMRVYGWRNLATEAAFTSKEWIPYPLIEVQCTTDLIPGPNNGVASGVADTEYLCNSIMVTNGWPGYLGEVTSFAAPGLPAFLMLDVRGSRAISFDFAQLDAVNMNAMWARA